MTPEPGPFHLIGKLLHAAFLYRESCHELWVKQICTSRMALLEISWSLRDVLAKQTAFARIVLHPVFRALEFLKIWNVATDSSY